MKNVLLDKGIILPSGEISKDKVNLVTGAITQPLLFTPPSESIKSDEIQKNILWITFGLLEAVVDRFQETFLQTGLVHITCLP